MAVAAHTLPDGSTATSATAMRLKRYCRSPFSGGVVGHWKAALGSREVTDVLARNARPRSVPTRGNALAKSSSPGGDGR